MACSSVVILAFLVLFGLGRGMSKTDLHPATGLNVFELAKFHGYTMEAHDIETEDGYILGVQRIPHGKTNKRQEGKPVVLMMHGLVSCSADWINIGPEKSLAYKLTELGYDVWMGNARGTAESRKHKTLDPDTDQKAFWSFSWNEIGRYDLPAMIDYILERTGQEQLQYVGYSQGTTAFFVMASSRPEYNAKLKLATTLAPAAELEHIEHPLARLLAPLEPLLFSIAEATGIREFSKRSEGLLTLAKQLCTDDHPNTLELCKIVLFVVGGYDRQQLDGHFITAIASNTPAGCNAKQFAHYGQVVSSKRFRNWDYHNETLNMEIYGTPEPPIYDLSKISAPISFFYGENDWLVSVTDAESTVSKLPNVINKKLVNYKAFTHIDFIWAIDVVELLYDDVIEVMERYR